jgi:hypothetical protein
MRLCTVRGVGFMNRDEVEMVLLKALEHLKPDLKKKITVVELFDLTEKIFSDIQSEETREEEAVHCCLSRSDIEKILTHGDLHIESDDGSRVVFVLEEKELKTLSLENGGVLVWDEGDEQ